MPAFTPGNIVVYRVGDGAAALGTGAAAVSLIEYTSAGSLVQTVAMPTADSGAHQMLTAAGSSTSEGLLTRSADGRYLILTGYDAAVGTAAVAGTSTTGGTPVVRVIGRVDSNAIVDTTTTTTSFSGGNIRGAASNDGTTFWATGNITGVVHTTLGGSGPGTIVSTTVTNLRGIDIYDGQLYVSSMSNPLRLGTVGSGMPTGTGATITNLTGFPGNASANSPYQFFFADLTGAVPGVDTLYVSDDRTIANGGGLLKYSLVSGSWVLDGTAVTGITTGLRGLAGDANGTTVTLYATTTQASANSIVSLIDTGGYNAAFSPATFTTVVTAAPNTAFRGLAFAPEPGGGETQTVSFNPVTVTHDEGNSGATFYTFTVTRTGGTTGILDFEGTIAPGTTDGADYTGGIAPTNFSGSMVAGQATAQVTVSVNGDFTIESSESFTLTLTSVINLSAIPASIDAGNGSATGNITNDDSPPVPGTLSIGDATIAEGNAGTTNAVFTVTRAGGDDGAVGATWTISFGSADAADLGSGQALTGTVSFADGDTSETITVAIAGDTVIEPNETFTVTLSAPTGGTGFGDASGAGGITNNDGYVFINEFHYDDAGTDAGEAIEVAGPAGTDLTGWSLVLYNLTGGASYATIPLSGVIPNQDDGYGTLSFLAAGLQNGPNDGIALVNAANIVVQFLSYEGTLVATNGPAIGMTSTDVGASEEPAVADGLSLQLVGTGAVYDDFTWAAAATSTFGAVNTGQDFLGSTATGLVTVGDASVLELNSGISNLIFTVERAGGIAQTASVNYVINLSGTADSADLAPGAVLAGTVSFDPGEASAQVLVTIQGDTTGEPNETLSIALSGAAGNITVTDANAVGTILNDDVVPAAIHDIQGASHTSPLLNQQVVTYGIVTGVDSNGFYLQDPSPDANDATSEGIFVFTSTSPTVAVGDAVSVNGLVAEFTAESGALSITEIINPVIFFNSSANPLPAATVIGTGGRIPPAAIFEDDNFTSFDPAVDGIDFYESLEGMRVTIDAPLVVANTNSFGETWLVASGGAGATGINLRDGITLTPGDFNPERIQIDDDANLSPVTYSPDHSQGDILGDVTGILSYSFLNYEVLVTEAVTTTTDVTLALETSTLAGDADYLSVASFNVENLDPTDLQSKFDAIADQIVDNLNAPDIIGLQEVQDADGAGTGTNYSGLPTAQMLIDAIVAAGGPTYQYVEIAPTSNSTTNGEPNGNIRNGYLYNAARVTYVAGSEELVLGAVASGARYPLAVDFLFNGETVTIIDNHFTSRGGSDALFGDNQPPANAGDGARLTQAQAVRAHIDALMATDPELNIIALGDFNSYYFEAPLQALQAGGIMTNLFDLLPVEERYSYMFEGNLQPFDNILGTPNMPLTSEFDAVHLNAEQGGAGPTDHDQALARILISHHDTIASTSGNDVRASGVGNDLFYLDHGGDDSASGGADNDTFYFGAAFTSADATDGGTGSDALALQGDYSGGLTFGADDLVSVETVALLTSSDASFGGDGPGPFSYDIATVNANVAAGLQLTVDGSALAAGEVLHFDGSAESDGRFLVIGGASDDLLTGGGVADSLHGQGGTDTITGLAGNDYIDGGAGVDTMTGGADNDTYVVDNSADRVIEADGEGNDFVYAKVNYTLNGGSRIETLSVTDHTASTALNFTGNEFGNNLLGNNGVNLLNGAGGADVMVGFGGDDIYAVDNAGDRVFENSGGGNDRIATTVSYVLQAGSHVEILSAADHGLATALALTGNELGNVVLGNEGANVLDGGGGADVMVGFGGNDKYAVDNAGDQVFESAGGGTDTVYATVSYSLAASADVETLTARDHGTTNAMDLTGNGLANNVYGNNGANTLDGGGGADVMIGFGGNDVYVVDNAGDIAIEAGGQGFDTVYAKTSYTLTGGSQIELLSAIDTNVATALNLTGNSFANAIVGTLGANTLNGGGGADYLEGYGGADNYAFTTALGGGNVDTIVGFDGAGVDGDDFILLENAVFTGLAAGALDENAFFSGAAAHDADDRIIYDPTTGALYFDADGTGAVVQVQFATLAGLPGSVSGDFIVI